MADCPCGGGCPNCECQNRPQPLVRLRKKHPDHANVFCGCFGPCSLCDADLIAEMAKNAKPIEFKTFELPGLARGNVKAVQRLALDIEANSMKDTTIGPAIDVYVETPLSKEK